jgi:hypothetical protein
LKERAVVCVKDKV